MQMNNVRALVADDVPANVRLLQARLGAEGIDVIAASNGVEAADICAREDLDIALLDVMMPGLSGYGACRRIKADPRSRHVPVVLVTALDEPSDRLRGIAAGADDFLPKPVCDVALLTRVRMLASLKRAQDAVARRWVAAADGAARTGGGAHILAIDPNPRELDRISKILGDAYRVTQQADARAGLRPMRDCGEVHLVLVAVSAPDAGEAKPCAGIVRPEWARDSPVIAMLEGVEPSHVSRVIESGADDYAAKPVDHHELRSRVAVLLRRKRLLDFLSRPPPAFSTGL